MTTVNTIVDDSIARHPRWDRIRAAVTAWVQSHDGTLAITRESGEIRLAASFELDANARIFESELRRLVGEEN